ncbi:isopeptide-forming domain-containing fimbrial protein [Calothrix sp. FACHB-156]|nr:isopeptide-forming domain-containing fimbrial protein [Calothrix sp. FACHB-156]
MSTSFLRASTRLFLTTAIICGSFLPLLKTVLADSTPPGTTIDNSATGSFEGETSGTTNTVTSNTVSVTVLEVAGITINSSSVPTEAPNNVTNAGTYQGIAGINTGDVVYFDFTITNTGNDPTQFFIPGTATITGGTLEGIQIIAVDPDGTGTASQTTVAVNVPSGGDNTINLLGTTNGYIPVNGTVKVRVAVKVTETVVNNSITVTLGNTPVPPNPNSQNQPYTANGNLDVYTVDLPNGTTIPSSYASIPTVSQVAEASGNPANGDSTNHRQEASANQSIALAATPNTSGYKSVQLTTDNDSTNSVTPGDKLTWRVTYANTGSVDISNFQITDALPAGVTLSTALAAANITVNATQATAPSPNTSYNGTGNNNLFAAGVTFKAGGVITIDIPVNVNAALPNGTILSNQPTANGSNLPTVGVKTDNIDNTTTGLPTGVTPLTNSILQTQNSSIDPTTVIVGTPTVVGYKSVKLTTDQGATGLDPGDTVTWTVIYKNTGTVDVPNFQITDTLPSGVTKSGTPTLVTASGGGQTSPTINSSYDGISNTNLFASGITLKAGGTIVVNIPVTINSGVSGTKSNQATAKGNNLTTIGINTDNVDSDTGITEVPAASIKQTQTGTIDPTVINIPATTPTPSLSGYKSVKLTNDLDSSSSITAGDTVTWSVTYINTGTVDVTNFQITDILPSGLTKSGSINITTNNTQGTAPTANSSYDGTGNNSLLQTPITFKAGGIITVTIPVNINAGASGTKSNQATANGGNISATNTDNVDSSTSGLPTGVTIPSGSVTQTQNPSIDPTTFTIIAPQVSGYKSVKLTTDADTSNSVTSGDTVTWTIIYKNSGTASVPNFQIADALPTGVTKTGTPTVSVSGVGQTTPTVDTNYNGNGNNNLFSTTVPLVAGGVIAVKIPVTINANQVGDKVNQAVGTGTGITAVNTDNVDNTTTLPSDVLAQIETGSIAQTQLASVDATKISIPEVQGFKSVKLTNDVDANNLVTAGDEITWTIAYKNTSTVPITNFQITDVLDSNVTRTGANPISVNVKIAGVSQTSPTINSAYTGSNPNANLIDASTPYTLPANAVITINVPVKIISATPANTVLSNQSIATASNLPSIGVKTDNVDSNPSTTLPADVTIPSNSIDQTENAGTIDPTTVTTTVPASSGVPNLLLVKRITAINGVNITGFVDDTTSAQASDDDHANWPTPKNTYLPGAINLSNIKPGDQLEYTIYYLSTGTQDATNVTICDLIPSNTTFLGTAFNGLTADTGGLPQADMGIAFANSNTSLPTVPTVYMTNVADGDRGVFYAPGSTPPAICKKPVSFTTMTAADNTNGLVVVNVVKSPATLPKATGSGTPNNSYGYIRFKVKVN